MAGSPAGAAGAGSAGAANAGSAAASMPLASALAGGPISFVNADVALDGEPVVGSFTVDGLTFAVAGDGSVELVGVSSQSLAALDAPTDLNAASAASETEADDTVLVLPESVSFEGADYGLTSIAPYAFYLSGVTSVELPASIDDVDERAFRSSDVSSVEVAEDNPSYASFDGILYDADLTRLLLIPGGRTGAARISSKAEEVDAAAFSHCAGVTAISVDAGSDHLSSWDGLLYDADGTTLLRVPAGATDITIREGCTTIAAGAMEGCAQLATITAPATVTSISPDVFTPVPTVSLPAAILAEDAPQLTALVALSATDDGLPRINPAAIVVNLSETASSDPWVARGFSPRVGFEAPVSNDDSLRDDDLALISQSAPLLEDLETRSPVATLQAATVQQAPVSGQIRLFSAESPSSQVNFMWVRQLANGTLIYAGGNNLGDGYNYAATLSVGYNQTGFYTGYTPGESLCYLAIVPAGSGGLTDLTEYVAQHQSLSDYTFYDIAYYYWGGNPAQKYDRHSTTAYQTFGNADRGYDFYLTPGKAKTVIWNGNQSTVDPDKANTSSMSYVGANRTCTAPSISVSDYPSGYSSYRWYSVAATSGGSYVCSANGTSPSIASDRTYYARWTKKTSHRVLLDANGGSNDLSRYYWPDRGYTTSSTSTSVVKPGSEIVPPSSLPTRAGYSFQGYYSDRTGGKQYIDADGKLTEDAPSLTGVATWYAHWARNGNHVITLEGNDGEQSISQIFYWKEAGYVASSDSTDVVEPGSSILSSIPLREDYAFKGYYSSTSSNATQYIDAGGRLTAKAPVLAKGDTWYAQWERTHVTITWDPNGESATVSPTSSKLQCGTTGLPLPLPVRPGYTYAYWHTSPTAYTPVWSTQEVPATDTVYYAHWIKKDSYSVTLDGNGATGAGTAAIYYWPERGYVSSSSSVVVIEPGTKAISSLPTRTGYAFRGYYSAMENGTQCIDANGNLASGAPALEGASSWYARWEKKPSYKVTLDGGEATGAGTAEVYYWPDKGYAVSESSTTVIEKGSKILDALPVRSGYSFKGYYSSREVNAARYIDAAGCLTTTAPVLTEPTVWYAQWVELGALTIYSAEDPSRTDAFSWLMFSGNMATGSGGGNRLGASIKTLWPVERTSAGFSVNERFYLTPSGYSSARPNISDYVLYDIAYYRDSGGHDVEPAVGWKQDGTTGALEVYLTPGTPRKVHWDAGEGTVEDAMSWVGDGRTCSSPVPVRDGYICTGWWTDRTGGDKVVTPGNLTGPITQDVTFYAQWTPKISAVTPVSVAVRLDILGINDQEVAEGDEGYVESRCVAPIEVSKVEFTPLAGAVDLFGEANVADVSLDGTVVGIQRPSFSFPLSTADMLEAASSDEAFSALRPFRMEAYGDRVYVAYRFGISADKQEDVLAAIDPVRFEGALTPVGSLTYTVSLATS